MSKSKGSLKTISISLCAAFIVLKIIGIINWSWWWVTFPIWGWFVLLSGIAVTLFINLRISKPIGRRENNFQRKMREAMAKAEIQKKRNESN